MQLSRALNHRRGTAPATSVDGATTTTTTTTTTTINININIMLDAGTTTTEAKMPQVSKVIITTRLLCRQLRRARP
jgi:hypothetical protein